MPTVLDEEYGPDGQLVSSTQRTISEAPPLLSELYDTRKQVKDIALNTAVPVWGRVLAKFLLLLSYYLVENRSDDNAPTP